MTKILRLGIVLLCLTLPFLLSAQVTTGSMSGIVKGKGGVSLEGATVKAVHTPTGTIYTVQSRKGGQFDIQNMETGGPYRITVTFVGYTQFETEDIYVRLGAEENVLVEMTEVGTELTNVVVTSTARGARSLKAGASSNFNERVILNFPNISRSLTNVTTLTPQAGGGNSFGGRDGRYNNIQIDGANLNNNFGLSSNPLPGGASQPISLDAIEEINVNISPYDVKQSNFTGAGINATTRRGTNTFTGSIYGFYRNEGLQGRKAAGKDVGTVNPSTAITYGGRLGGPIIKDKLFFFVNGEYDKRDQPGLVWEATRPGTTAGPNTSRTTAEDLDRVSDLLRTRYGYETGAYENLGNYFTESKKFLGRLDWNVTRNHTFSVRYNYMEGTDDQTTNGTSAPNPRAASNRWSRNSMSYANSLYNFTNKVSNFSAELKSRFGNNMSNQLLATYTKISDLRGSNSSEFPFVDIWKDGDAYLSFGYELFSYKNQVENEVFIITDNFTYNVGKHSFTAGISYEDQSVLNGFLRYGTSYYRYASLDDFINDRAPSAFGLTYPYAGQDPFASLRFGQVAAYLQDEMRVNDRFKLSFGIRFDMPLFLNELTENPGISALTFRGMEGEPYKIDVSQWPKSRVIVSPRVGFNWDVNGDRSLVIRGGAGIFTGRFPFVWFTNQPTNAGVIQNTAELSASNANQAAILQGIRFDPDKERWQSLFPQQPAGSAPGSIASVDPDFRMPVVFRTNIGIDKKLGNDWTLTLEGIYNKDVNALFQYNANFNQSVGTLPGPDKRPTWTSATRRVQPSVNEAMVLTNTGKGWGVVGTAQLQKRFNNNWQASLAYNFTYAAELTGNPGSQAASAWSNVLSINGNNDLPLTLSDYATLHRVVGWVTYRKEWLRHLGTSISLVYTGYHQGRFSYRYSTDINGDGLGSNDLMYVPANASEIIFVQNGAFTPQQQSDAFFAYVEQDKYLSSRMGQYTQRNGAQFPWFSNLDARLLQDIFTTIGKNNRRHTIQLSFEMENFTNLISSDWGVQKRLVVNNGALLRVQDFGGPNGQPRFRLNTVNNELPTSTFESIVNINQTWRLNFGLRYSF